MRKMAAFLMGGACVLCLIAKQGWGQCNTQSFLNQCASKLGEYQLAKAYKIDRNTINKGEAPSKIEYTYVLQKGTRYKFNICNGMNDNKMIVKLYDRNHNLIASSYSQDKQKHYSALGYQCKATGTYYITFSFEQEGSSCGLCILGFNK